METTLLFKTMVILTSQLFIVYITGYYCILKARQAYKNDSTFLDMRFKGSVNMKGKLDLIPYFYKDTFPKRMSIGVMKKNKWGAEVEGLEYKHANNQEEVIELLREGYKHDETNNKLITIVAFNAVVSIGALAFISFFDLGILLGMTFFTLTSLSLGAILGIIFLEMDENDGFAALKITISITLITGFVGYSDFISFSESKAFGVVLMLCLLGLIIFNLSRSFMEMSRSTVKVGAIFGSILFTLFLLYDFNYIAKQENAINNWSSAVEMAYILYLDIINLLLEILEAMD